MRRKGPRLAATAMALVLIAAACGDDSGDDGASDTTAPAAQESIGEGEGALSVLTWPYYAEDGSFNDGLDWVTPFEEETGCDTTVKYFATGDEAYQLFGTGDYDVVSPSGDQSMRMVAADYAAPINTDLIDTYDELAPFLKDQPNNSIDGTVYGIPHGWGANVLQYNTEEVSPAPTSWSLVWEADSPYAGKIAAYDSPIYIADAALYLMDTQPDLGIEDPYALDQEQFDAAIQLLKDQNGLLSEYWSDYVAYEDNFRSGNTVLGTSWQVITNTLQADPSPVDAVLPDEGSTAWSDNWMLHADAEHPNCAYEWINYITSASVQATVSSTYGESPASLAACTETLEGVDMAAHCEAYHTDDEAYYEQLHYWTTPIKECLDGRTDVECKDYSEWVAAWTEVKG